MSESITHSRLRPRKVRPYEGLDGKALTDEAVRALAKIGIVFDHATVREQIKELARAGAFDDRKSGAMDSAFTAPITTPSAPTPLQFLQAWLPGFVKVITAARKIDDIIGLKTVGQWRDREIVQTLIEPAASATEYGDYTSIPLTSYNVNFERRSIVRGELGFSVGVLEEDTAAAMRLSSAETKRQAAAVGLEIMRNAIGFYGWNNGNNRTFGFLNDPNLPAYVNTTTAGWNGATFQQIQADLRFMVKTLRTQSQDTIDPEKVDITLALPMDKVDYLTTTTDFGISVRDWLKQTYPRIRIVSAPELVGANGGQDIAVMFAEEIESSIDGSTDGGEVFAQMVQTKFVTIGVEKRAKIYVEDFSNATAGVICKRGYAVVRMTGI